MIKILSLLILLSVSSGGVAQDIIIKSRFDHATSTDFIKNIRSYLINNDYGDPYRYVRKEPVEINLNSAIASAEADSARWLTELQQLMRVKLFDSDYDLVIDKLQYEMHDLTSDFNPAPRMSERIDYVTSSSANGIKISAERVSFNFKLANTTNGKPIQFSLQLKRPVFTIRPNVALDVMMGWMSQVSKDNLILTLNKINMEKVFDSALKDPDLIDLKMEDFIFPDVSIRVGNRNVRFDNSKIKSFLLSKKNIMKKTILELVSKKMRDELRNVLEGYPLTFDIPKVYVLETQINGVFNINEMKTDLLGMLQVDLKAFFCDKDKVQDLAICKDGVITSKLRRKITEVQYKRSLREINRELIEQQTNIAISVSEDYLNQMVQATLEAGLLDDALKGKEFHLGPEKAFIISEEKGPTFSLYMDMVYPLKGVKRLLLGLRELKFPIRFQIAMKIINQNNVPHLKINIVKVDTPDDLIINGLPEYNLHSNIKNARLKKKILEEVNTVVKEFEGMEAVDIDLPAFRDTHIEKMTFKSDGNGRANALMRFNQI